MNKILNLFIPLFLICLLQSCAPEENSNTLLEKPVEEIQKEQIISKIKETIGNRPILKRISTDKDALIVTESGIKVSIKKNSFVDQYGNVVSGNVDVSIQEAVALKDIITEEMSTITSDGILETRGMINIQVSQNGKELNLAPNQRIDIDFPKEKNENEEIGIFYGVSDSTGSMIWAPSGLALPKKEEYNKKVHISVENYDGIDNDFQWLSEVGDRKKLIEDAITFTETEKRNLLYQKIDIYWILFADGDLEVYKVSGNISKAKKKEIETKLNNIPFVKPYQREGDVAEISGVVQIYFKKNSNGYDYENYYYTASDRLGWINCDIFIKYNVPKVDMYVEASENCILKVKFQNYKTIVTGKKGHGRFYFSQLPEGEPIEIIAIDYNENGVLYSETKTTVSKSTKTIDPFENVSMDEFKVRLANLE